MKKRLLVVAICMLGLPVWSSTTQSNKLIDSAPYATVAFAGHVTGGSRYCDCGTADCVCDAGETARQTSRTATSDSTQPYLSSIADDTGLGLLALTMLLLWLKLRA